MADQKPFLFDGRDLREFARQKSAAQKWSMPETNAPWNYFLCFRCKGYRKPYLLMADYIPATPVKGRLSSICRTCDGAIMKFCRTDQISKICTTLDVTHQSGSTTLTDSESS
nr:hypothetical protein [Roseovarius sp. W115]MDV2931187.1 hypothetical protein [Roseovarius sp. W115]